MGEIKTGGQAFPHGDPTNGGDLGMDLRDWFAGQALAGGLCTGQMPEPELRRRFPHSTSVDMAEIIACQAYGVADALLAALEGVHHD